VQRIRKGGLNKPFVCTLHFGRGLTHLWERSDGPVATRLLLLLVAWLGGWLLALAAVAATTNLPSAPTCGF